MKWIVLFSLCFSIFGDSLKVFKSPLNFNSSIAINNERGIVSSGDIFIEMVISYILSDFHQIK